MAVFITLYQSHPFAHASELLQIPAALWIVAPFGVSGKIVKTQTQPRNVESSVKIGRRPVRPSRPLIFEFTAPNCRSVPSVGEASQVHFTRVDPGKIPIHW